MAPVQDPDQLEADERLSPLPAPAVALPRPELASRRPRAPTLKVDSLPGQALVMSRMTRITALPPPKTDPLAKQEVRDRQSHETPADFFELLPQAKHRDKKQVRSRPVTIADALGLLKEEDDRPAKRARRG
jgi:hypothetical protein